MKKIILILCSIILPQNISSQNRKLRPLIWATHEKNTDIVGVSLGFYSTDNISKSHLTRTFGLRIESIIISPLYLLSSVLLQKINQHSQFMV